MQVLPGKQIIAWFALAEFVQRKEKERALGVHRLLAHSLGNNALVAQLEGDILRSFNDMRAETVYGKALDEYEKQGCFAQAAAVGEYLFELHPESEGVAFRLCSLYARLHNYERIQEIACQYQAAAHSIGAYDKLVSFQECVRDLLKDAVVK